ncbi:hypothetical protein BDN67DRAFT_365223 [Paxillus ammoniavirescens]|nr:hypothetical protein BDN67DRAFT_365223 [Paxillus ammoniavirescens]
MPFTNNGLTQPSNLAASCPPSPFRPLHTNPRGYGLLREADAHPNGTRIVTSALSPASANVIQWNVEISEAPITALMYSRTHGLFSQNFAKEFPNYQHRFPTLEEDLQSKHFLPIRLSANTSKASRGWRYLLAMQSKILTSLSFSRRESGFPKGT